MCTLSATRNFLESHAFKAWLGAAFSAFAETSACKSSVAGSQLIEAVRLRQRRPSQTLSELRLVSEITKERDYEVLKRFRLIRSFLIFDSRASRGMPTLWPPPAGPETSPSPSPSPAPTIPFSCPLRFVT